MRSLSPHVHIKSFITLSHQPKATFRWVVKVLVLKLDMKKSCGTTYKTNKVLLEDSNEPLGTAVSLRFVDKSRRRLNAKECSLLLKKIRNKLGTVIMAKRETLSNPFSKSAEEIADTLPDRLKGFKASSSLGSMDSHTLHRAVINSKEDGHLALFSRKARGLVDSPHPVHQLCSDHPIVGLPPGAMTDTTGSKKIVLLHEPEDSSFGGPDSLESQPRPHLPIALTVKGRTTEKGTDLLNNLIIAQDTDWSSTPRSGFRAATMKVEGRSWNFPHATNPGQAIAFSRGGREALAHFPRLLRDKGRFCSSLVIFSRRSSDYIVASPSFSRSCLISSVSRSSSLLMAACPARRKSSLHREIRAAVVPHSLERSSKSSPRKRRKTIWPFDFAENRLGLRAGPSPPRGCCLRRPSVPTLTFIHFGHLHYVLSYALLSVQVNCRLMYLAARLVKTSRRLKLLFSLHCPGFVVFHAI